jgi:hypothetical protein
MYWTLHQQSAQQRVAGFGDTQLGLRLARIVLTGGESHESSHRTALAKALWLLEGEYKVQTG